jgi:hypothetical protein
MKPGRSKAMTEDEIKERAQRALDSVVAMVPLGFTNEACRGAVEKEIREAVEAEAARAEKAEARMAELEAERDLLALVQRATEANGGQP